MQDHLEKDAEKKIRARIILYHIDLTSLICGKFYTIINSGGDDMRQADSTIRGYLYQFNKSIYEILQLNDDEEIILEGVIEDIDIQSPTSTTTIQCKYHEDKKYLISGVATPILEMLCHYYECHALGKSVSYILYAYYEENTDSVTMDAFADFLNTTKDKDIQIKYFHRIYTIPDDKMLAIAIKPQKKKVEKQALLDYYKDHRDSLALKVSIEDFWARFRYEPAEQFDVLKENIMSQFEAIVDIDTARTLYYPNSFSFVANCSAKSDVSERIVSKAQLLAYLSTQKSVLLNRWTLAAMDQEKVLKDKKKYLSGYFAGNTDIRAFVFSDEFLEANKDKILPFLIEYLNKYFKKPHLHRQPIFIFGNNHSALQQSVLLGLYQYQKPVNYGTIGECFSEDSFINNTNCSPSFTCKITLEKNISANLLERCQVNQLYIIGKMEDKFNSPNYFVEMLDVENVNALRYLVGLSMKLEV